MPQTVLSAMRKQARIVWGVSLFLLFVWISFILLAPFAENHGLTSLSAPIYKFFSYICHQMAERSFSIGNAPFAVCARCFGVYFGLLLGVLIYPFFNRIEETEPPRRIWLFLSLIPMGIDWALGVFGIWENTHWSRLATGVVLGVVCALFIVPALIELFRLLLHKK